MRRRVRDAGSRPREDAAAGLAPHVRMLRDGHRVLIRPLMATDRAELAARYAELSPAARRARFGMAPEELTDERLDELLDIDYDDRFALAAVAIDEPGSPGVGVARYARRNDDPTAAEAAAAVLDAYQHRGIGTWLLLDLVEAARARGITTFVATVRWDNTELLDALRARGATLEPTEPGVAALRIDLAQVDGAPPD